jgi:diguanylate cyclase (GGDEF)-like protein
MKGLRSAYSIFFHPQDRGVFVSYFLGAVVPLIALGFVVEQNMLSPIAPPIDRDLATLRDAGILVLFTAISFLSLGSFLMLRHLVRESIETNRALGQYDSLTGLLNWWRFKERLEQDLIRAQRQGGFVATCFLDLDRFKRINDTLGHSRGDRLLCEVAARLVSVVRRTDAVARVDSEAAAQTAVSRLGGDEFTFLVPGISDAQDAGRVARRALRAICEPFRLDGQEIFVTACIGMAVSPLDGEDAETLLKNAGAAMYVAKSRGCDGFQFYSKSMNQAAERKLEVERRLRRAFEHDSLSLHYQPMVDAVSGATLGAEALLRWDDPDLGSVSPSEFVPIAEDTGLIVPIGEWVLRTACAQAKAWQAAGFRPIRISVNVSGHQLRQPTFVERVEQTLHATGLSPAYLELEITESTIMREDEVSAAAFRSLDELAVGLVLDDFGTGYSSLSHLRRFPIGRVKIDRSFVAEIPRSSEDMAVAAAIVAMAHTLLLTVVAEGVENLEQARSLRELGCEELQGYLFSAAVPAGGFERFLEREKPDETTSNARRGPE